MFFLGAVLYISSLCSTCGPQVDTATTQAIISVESGGNPYAIGDNFLRRTFTPKTRAEAETLARQLLSQGHSIDMGLMQVNSQHLSRMKIGVEELFDPCTNIRVGTTILSDFYRRNDHGEDRSVVLFKALSAYNTGSAWKGPEYINRVLRAIGANYRVSIVNPPKTSQSKIEHSKKKPPRKNVKGEQLLTDAGEGLFFTDSSRLAGNE